MDEPLWTPERSKDVGKSLRKYKSDKVVTKKFYEKVKRLIHEENPADLAREQTNGRTYTVWITKSVRLEYWMNYDTKVLHLGQLGDHKQVFGSD